MHPGGGNRLPSPSSIGTYNLPSLSQPSSAGASLRSDLEQIGAAQGWSYTSPTLVGLGELDAELDSYNRNPHLHYHHQEDGDLEPGPDVDAEGEGDDSFLEVKEEERSPPAHGLGASTSAGPSSGTVQDQSTGKPTKRQTEKTAKKTRNRKPSSCVACRKKKLRCNRIAPCNQCTSRGDAAGCLWDDATPLFDAREQHDTEELKAHVARLESLVRYLTSNPTRGGSSDISEVPTYLLPKTESTSSSSPSDSQPPPPPTHSHPHSHSTYSFASAARDPSPEFDQFPSSTSASSAGKAGSPANFKGNSHSSAPLPTPPYEMDLRSNDLCEALSQLAIKEFVTLELGSGSEAFAPSGANGADFIDEAKKFMDALPQRFAVSGNIPPINKGFGEVGVSKAFAAEVEARHGGASGGRDSLSPGPLGSSAFHRAAPPLEDVLKFLPTDKEAMSAYTYFTGYVSWYSHPVHLSTFESQWAHLKQSLQLSEEERVKEIDPFFIATFLGVLAMGLAMMPVKRATRDGFPVNKEVVVDRWLEGAMLALTCGKFLDNPSVEAVRAIVVICTYFVFMSPGESSGAGMVLLSLSVHVSMSLGLHRDPDRSPSKFSFCEAEERRRLFWNLFTLCILSSASLGRTWAIFDLEGVDTKLPLDCHDHEIINEFAARAGTEARRRKSEETPMTSLLCKMKLAVMAKKLNDRAFGIKPVGYTTVLELDRELKEFEDSIPERYQLRLDSVGALIRPTPHVTVTEMRACMVQISLASEFIRLHRPWLVLASTDPQYQYSRDQAIKYAKLLLAVYRSPSCNKQLWGGLTYKATNAGIVLAVELLSFPNGSDAASHRALVKATMTQMESHIFDSSLCRKGSRILRFLLEKDIELSAERDQLRHSKRARQAEVANPFPSRLAAALYPPSAPPPSSRDSDDHLYHKSSQGPADSASSTYYRAMAGSRPPPLPLPTSHRHPAHFSRPTPPLPPPPPPPKGPSISSGADANFSNLAGNFAFDFMLPSPSPYPYAFTPVPPSPYATAPYASAPYAPSHSSYTMAAPDPTQFPPTPASSVIGGMPFTPHLPPSPSPSAHLGHTPPGGVDEYYAQQQRYSPPSYA